jgi:hypothetical protein
LAHKTKIGGTAYEIGSGKVLVGGTGYSIDKGRTKVDGTGYDIAFGIPIGSLAVGSSVFFNVAGTSREFIVVHQGKPSSYDTSCDGTWLLMKDIYTERIWDNSSNDYSESDIRSYLEYTFTGLIDSDIRSAIKNVKIPCTNGTGLTGAISNLKNLSANVFLLSFTEIGCSSSQSYVKLEGVVLDYFNGATDSDRICYMNGTAGAWWLRTPRLNGSTSVCVVTVIGKGTFIGHDDKFGIRPAFILPTDFDVANYLA